MSIIYCVVFNFCQALLWRIVLFLSMSSITAYYVVKYCQVLSQRIVFVLQLRQEKVELEETLEKEQEYQVNKLMKKIEKLEADTLSKQTLLEQVSSTMFLFQIPAKTKVLKIILKCVHCFVYCIVALYCIALYCQLRREKVELENALEQEQEALVNKLWKRMDKLEAEKRLGPLFVSSSR